VLVFKRDSGTALRFQKSLPLPNMGSSWAGPAETVLTCMPLWRGVVLGSTAYARTRYPNGIGSETR
jgi:hypothetical protein